MAWTITFNSFKGGSGRSTTCINIAAQLARRDKRVLVIDLDIDGPGLGTLLGLTDKEIEKRGIVSFLSGSDADAIRNHILKVKIDDSAIDFMGAPLNADASTFEMAGTDLPDRMMSLRTMVEDTYDFVLIDAASGISNTSALAFAVSDSICLCFRWSRQHFRGTMMTLSIVCKMLEAEHFPLKDFALIANAVPRPISSEEAEIVREVRRTINSVLRDRFKSTQLPNGLPMPKILEIWEIPTMKFDERIVPQHQDSDLADYKIVANYLIERARMAGK